MMNLELIKANALAIVKQCMTVEAHANTLHYIKTRPKAWIYEPGESLDQDISTAEKNLEDQKTILMGMLK